jgi:hypothetical protein
MGAHSLVPDAAHESAQLLLEARAPLRRRPIALAPLALEENIDQRPRSGEDPFHRFRALLADQVVGIEPIGKEGEHEAHPGLQDREHGVDGAKRGFVPGRIAVEAENGLGRHAPQELHLVRGQGCAEGSNRLGNAGLGEGDRVHVAFDHEDATPLVGGSASAMGIEQNVTLVKERCLRRVQVFGRLVGIERAAAEGDNATLHVGNREHYPVTEPVKRRPIIDRDKHARSDHVFVAKSFCAEVGSER